MLKQAFEEVATYIDLQDYAQFSQWLSETQQPSKAACSPPLPLAAGRAAPPRAPSSSNVGDEVSDDDGQPRKANRAAHKPKKGGKASKGKKGGAAQVEGSDSEPVAGLAGSQRPGGSGDSNSAAAGSRGLPRSAAPAAVKSLDDVVIAPDRRLAAFLGSDDDEESGEGGRSQLTSRQRIAAHAKRVASSDESSSDGEGRNARGGGRGGADASVRRTAGGTALKRDAAVSLKPPSAPPLPSPPSNGAAASPILMTRPENVVFAPTTSSAVAAQVAPESSTASFAPSGSSPVEHKQVGPLSKAVTEIADMFLPPTASAMTSGAFFDDGSDGDDGASPMRKTAQPTSALPDSLKVTLMPVQDHDSRQSSQLPVVRKEERVSAASLPPARAKAVDDDAFVPPVTATGSVNDFLNDDEDEKFTIGAGARPSAAFSFASDLRDASDSSPAPVPSRPGVSAGVSAAVLAAIAAAAQLAETGAPATDAVDLGPEDTFFSQVNEEGPRDGKKKKKKKVAK
jgi:hypothetical protein